MCAYNIISTLIYLYSNQKLVLYLTFLQTSGVPKGSIPGPLLFIIVINDNAASFELQYLLYVDDVKIFCHIETIMYYVNLYRNLLLLKNWCQKNNLALNVDKCNVMSFHGEKKLLNPYSL